MTQVERNRRLVEAIQQLDVSGVETLLAEGADPNAIAYGTDIEGLYLGEIRSDPYVIELLFEDSMYIAETNDIRPEVGSILLMLIEKGGDPNLYVQGYPLIARAAGSGLDACVLSLL